MHKKVKKKMNFKACAVRETGVYSDVNEDFEHKRNEEIRFTIICITRATQVAQESKEKDEFQGLRSERNRSLLRRK